MNLVISKEYYILVSSKIKYELLNFLKMKDKLSEAIEVKLLEGKRYSFCSCGFSKNLPYCDNAHREYNEKNRTDYKSLKFTQKDTEVLFFQPLGSVDKL